MNRDPDRLDELVRRAARGEEEALAELFSCYRGRLRQMIRLRLDRRVQGRVDPSDVLQDAYIDMAERLPEYDSRAAIPFFVWLRMVVGERHEVVSERLEEVADVGGGPQRLQILAGPRQPPEMLEVVDQHTQLVDLTVHPSDDVEAAIVGQKLPVVAQHLPVPGDDRDQVADLVAEDPQKLVCGKTGERIVAGVPDSHLRRRLSPPATAA